MDLTDLKQGEILDRPHPAKAWVSLFDASTSAEKKRLIYEAFRSDFASGSKEYPGISASVAAKRSSLDALPSGIIIVPIMASGYLYGRAVYEYMNSMGRSDKFIFAGYSSGQHSKDKVFSNGTSMSGKLYIPGPDLEFLLENTGSTILLVDNVMETGATVRSIANTMLHSIGVEGQVYEYIDHSTFDGSYQGVRQLSDINRPLSSKDVVTEKGRMLYASRR